MFSGPHIPIHRLPVFPATAFFTTRSDSSFQSPLRLRKGECFPVVHGCEKTSFSVNASLCSFKMLYFRLLILEFVLVTTLF